MSHHLSIHDGTGLIAKDPGLGILLAYGSTVPGSVAGYAPGCHFIKTDGVTEATVCYFNVGTSSSANFVALDINATESAYISGVTPGTVAASKAVVVDANKDAASFRDITVRTVTQTGNGITSAASPAAAGSAQGDATALTADNNFVTGADGTKGVVLPTAVAGMRIVVKSVTGGSALKVYPASGGTINALAANGAISMGSLTAAIFVASSATQWYTVPLLPS